MAPPYVNALANSVASVVQNWMQEKPTKRPKKTAAPLMIMETATSARAGVQSTYADAHPNTIAPA